MMSNQTRFNQLIDSIEGMNPKILSTRLKEMEKDGLIHRKIYHETPIRIEKQTLTAEEQQQQQQESLPFRLSSEYELALLEKQKVEGTDVMSFKFSKQHQNDKQHQEGEKANDKKRSLLDYTAGQYAFFDIGGVYNDPKGPIRHFTSE